MTTLVDREIERQAKLAGATLRKVAGIWRLVDVKDLSGSWPTFSQRTYVAIAAAQRQAAANAGEYISAEADAAGIDVDRDLVPDAFGGYASDGRPLDTLLILPLVEVKQRIATGSSVQASLASGWVRVQRIVDTQVRDAGRIAGGVGITANTGFAGYVRQLGGQGCARCAVLAGKFYRWNAGFLRHVHCKCTHQPVASRLKDELEEQVQGNPKAYFDSLGRAEQDRIFTADGAQAIRDGADLGQVVNSRRGMYVAGGRSFTREGITSRGYAGRKLIAASGSRTDVSGFATRISRNGPVTRAVTTTRARIPRLTPEQIYREAKSNRDEAIRLLTRFGYI